MSVTVIKGFACPLNERGHRAGQLSQICMTRCASYRSSSRKADDQVNGKSVSLIGSTHHTTEARPPQRIHRFTINQTFAEQRLQACCFLTLSGNGAGSCCHEHVGPVYFILRCWLVVSRIGQGTGPKTPAPLRRTPAAFHVRG